MTRKRKITDKRGQVHEIEVTVYGWKLIVLIEARTTIPLAATVDPIQEHETLSLRALTTQARTNLASPAHLHKVVFDKRFWDGMDLWWLAQHGRRLVVPAKDNMAVTVDAQAQAAAGEGGPLAVECIPYAMAKGEPRGPNGWRLRSREPLG